MPATIYFSGSISGGRQDVALYATIVKAMRDAGHVVLAGAVADENVASAGEAGGAEAIFARDLHWVEESNLVVAEVSVPSLGVGYEIAAARYRYAIPVIALWRPAYAARCSAMIAGDPGIQLIEYEEPAEMLPQLVAEIAKYAEG